MNCNAAVDIYVTILILAKDWLAMVSSQNCWKCTRNSLTL